MTGELGAIFFLILSSIAKLWDTKRKIIVFLSMYQKKKKKETESININSTSRRRVKLVSSFCLPGCNSQKGLHCQAAE